MAEQEIKRVITVDTSQATSAMDSLKGSVDNSGKSFKSLKEYKQYIDSLTASMLTMDSSSDEYAKTAKAVQDAQANLNKVMGDSKNSSSAVEGSYNALTKQLAELRKAWKSTGDEAERDEIGKQMLEINSKLKDLDASVGNYQRNVGNYESAFTAGLANIGKQAAALNSPMKMASSGVKALGGSLKALIANPVGAVIMVIVGAIKLLQKGFKSSEEATNKLKKAFSALEPVTNAISNVFSGLANVIGDIAEKWIPAMVDAVMSAVSTVAGWLNKIGIVSDETLAALNNGLDAAQKASEKTRELAAREIQLEQDKRDAIVETAKLEEQISEARAKAADKENVSAKDRKKYLDEAIANEKKLSATKLRLAEEEYNIAKERAKLTANDKETNEKLAQSEANLYNIRKAHNDKMRELNAQASEAYKKQLQDELNLIVGRLSAYSNFYSTQLSVTGKYAEDYWEIQQKIIDNEYAAAEANAKYKKKIATTNEEYKLAEIERANAEYKRSVKTLNLLREQGKALINYQVEMYGRMSDLDSRQNSLDNYEKHAKDRLDAQYKLNKKIYEQEKRSEGDLILLEAEYYQDLADLNYDINRRRLNADKEYIDTKVELTRKGSVEYYNALKEQENKAWEIRLAELEHNKVSDEQLEIEVALHTKRLRDIYDEYVAQKQQAQIDNIDFELGLENEMTTRFKELTMERFDVEWEMYTMSEEYLAQSEERKDEITRQHNKEREKLAKESALRQASAIAGTVSQFSGMMGDLFSALSDNFEEGSKEAKAFQIAATTMNILGGVAGAVASAFNPANAWMTIWGQAAMAAVTSATVIATGVAQLTKIKQTSMGSTPSLGDSAASVSTPSFTPTYTTAVQSASDMTELQNAVSTGTSQGTQDIKCYVVESDITAVGNRVQVRENESTF